MPLLRAANLDNLYLIEVLVVALAWGERPVIFTAVLSAVVFDYCFVPPRFSFAITDLAYVVTLGGFLAVAIVTSRLAAYSRELTLVQSAREHAEALSDAKDELLIEQIVTNLVMNAIKFTPPGGLVTVKLSCNKESAELVVNDTGAGIAEEFIPHLFDPVHARRSGALARRTGTGTVDREVPRRSTWRNDLRRQRR